ncbi:MAG: hypothetical protein KAS48_01515 [Gammaproteobacteria bacterium]|nr:hypothetical protein [Gammaproteobacteria bacterium]
MTKTVQRHPNFFRRFFSANMIFGLLITAISVYLIITGQYENLAARQASETVLNMMAIGGLLYVVTFWYLAIFTKPLTSSSDNGQTAP